MGPREEDLQLVADLRSTGNDACAQLAEMIERIYEQPATAHETVRRVHEHLVAGGYDAGPATLEHALQCARRVGRSLLVMLSER